MPESPDPREADFERARRVLVIDDEEGMREAIRRVLEKKGFRARTAADGETALAMLAAEPFDIALVDLKLPGVDGFQVTEHISRTLGNRTVTVIVSALATVEAAVEVTRHGAFDFLVKPFTPDDLMEVMERASKQWRLLRDRETYLSEASSERTLSHQMINSMREGVVVLNIMGKPALMNPRAEFFLGRKWNDGLTMADLFGGTPVMDAASAVLANPEKGDSRMVHVPQGGMMLQVGVTPLQLNGDIGGAVVILTDVTEAWEAEQDKNRFVSMVAHELKSPLAAILNFINVILAGTYEGEPEKVEEALRRCKIRGEALLELIQDLLEINRRDAGKQEKSIEELDLRKVLAEQLDFHRGQAERRGISVVFDAAGPPCPVQADRGDLDRIFVNLISNGIKYNREGGRLEIGISETPSGWEVKVADTGFGMTPVEMKSLFEEFYRVKNARTSGIAGTGLGLATVKRVLAGYNGRIDVRSVPEEGTVFTVTLPRHR